ncbi:MAG: hypothetical protein WCH83_16815 [Alphaproteobacteria bacterium]
MTKRNCVVPDGTADSRNGGLWASKHFAVPVQSAVMLKAEASVAANDKRPVKASVTKRMTTLHLVQ